MGSSVCGGGAEVGGSDEMRAAADTTANGGEPRVMCFMIVGYAVELRVRCERLLTQD